MSEPAAPLAHQRADLTASVRMILEGLILAALLWSARAQVETQTQIAVLQENVVAMRAQMADVPGLQQRMTRTETRLDAVERQLESRP